MTEFYNGRLIATIGDITDFEVDAIVNAANSSLLGGGGVDGAIHRRGGPAILQECKQLRRHSLPDGLPTGKAVITGGGRLAARYVIHTVGPVWQDGNRREDALLEACYRNSLDLAAGHAATTVAFPAISTGVYGFPRERAARVAFGAIGEYLYRNTVPRTVYCVFFSHDDYQEFVDEANAILQAVNDQE
ncbi:MAG: O-acetyl-ADP-ribose deacetylase [Spirochaetaceae bacterium]|nr:MAG: O-acetyl-ADP-ribose deacetylase [Spirochaetaceae bacterium]